MLQYDGFGGSGRGRGSGHRFTLYVEGPRDRSILRAWAYRLLPSEARRLFRASVILGGRQPARALDHFRSAGAGAGGARALCVLDRDDGGASAPHAVEAGLEFFTWRRRHIESYLLVPTAIRRALRLPQNDRRVERVLEGRLPEEGDASAWSDLDAKRLLGPKGELPRVLGRPLPLEQIARVTREDELHPDVLSLFERLRAELAP